MSLPFHIQHPLLCYLLQNQFTFDETEQYQLPRTGLFNYATMILMAIFDMDKGIKSDNCQAFFHFKKHMEKIYIFFSH
jgi:hypothetical protein